MSASPRTLVFSALLAASALATPAHADPAMPQELTDALAGKYKGTVVTAFGAFADADEVKFNQNIKAFEEQTGIDIQYASSKQFEATIATRVDAGNTPDLVDFPQPGLMGNFSKTGKLVDLASVLGADYLKAQYQPSWLDMGTKPGPDGKPTLVGIWERVNVKSLVWYPKKPFE
ncbi:extracellular solute-binding protein, partial [Pleomorphomonas koreensis]|uniref:extracellular solute-binding protein n=1 Tax=Pleomorphomonas koreensis TaxID=257440 RepID=UPI0012EBF587